MAVPAFSTGCPVLDGTPDHAYQNLQVEMQGQIRVSERKALFTTKMWHIYVHTCGVFSLATKLGGLVDPHDPLKLVQTLSTCPNFLFAWSSCH